MTWCIYLSLIENPAWDYNQDWGDIVHLWVHFPKVAAGPDPIEVGKFDPHPNQPLALMDVTGGNPVPLGWDWLCRLPAGGSPAVHNWKDPDKDTRSSTSPPNKKGLPQPGQSSFPDLAHTPLDSPRPPDRRPDPGNDSVDH